MARTYRAIFLPDVPPQAASNIVALPLELAITMLS